MLVANQTVGLLSSESIPACSEHHVMNSKASFSRITTTGAIDLAFSHEGKVEQLTEDECNLLPGRSGSSWTI